MTQAYAPYKILISIIQYRQFISYKVKTWKNISSNITPMKVRMATLIKKRVDFRAKIIVIIIMGQREAPYSVKMVNLSRRHGTSKNV